MARAKKQHYVDKNEMRKELYECQLKLVAFLSTMDYEEDVDNRIEHWLDIRKFGKKTRTKEKNKLDRAEYYEQIWRERSLQYGASYCSPALQKMLYDISKGLAKKPNFRAYTYRDDFVNDAAMLLICNTWTKFNLDGYSEKTGELYSPLAYHTQACYNSFVTFINHEQKQSKIVQAILKDEGMQGSWATQVQNDEDNRLRRERRMSEESTVEIDDDSIVT